MRHFGLPLVLAGLFMAGCDSGGEDPDDMETGSLILSVRDMTPVPNEYHMEGWVVTWDSQTKSIGKFAINESGVLVDLSGTPVTARRFDTNFALDSLQSMFVTIEPAGDTNDTPSNTRLMGGLFVDGQAALRAEDVEGIEDELILARGNYIVDSPTDGPGTNESSGVWFVNLTGGPPARGLRTAIPIQGWQYQGWIEFDGIPVDMGVIPNHTGADESSLHSGPLPGYNYPGEDFLINPPDGLSFPVSVGNAYLYVTLEPDPDPDPAPSQFKIFDARIPAQPVQGQTYNMENLIDGFPKGTATIVN